jgi:putative membrane protein insertion efficiency factor
MKTLLILPVQAYRYTISPLLGDNCRYYPSCSAYAEEALARHGAAKGLYLATHRILRCHPFSRGGLDPVPDTFTFNPRRES